MRPAEHIEHCTRQHILLNGQDVEYRIVHSQAAKKLRIKVRLDGIDVVVPADRENQEAIAFVTENRDWVIEQLERARTLRALRRPEKKRPGMLLFGGEMIPVNVVRSDSWRAPNKIVMQNEGIALTCGQDSQTPLVRSLENWLRKQARESVMRHVVDIGKRLNREPNRIYIMDQKTKWGNCSTLGNLSFNWRLIMAPEYVFRYIVTHEMVHLAIPDHSQRFWLTVQSLCPNTDKARQWLVANAHKLMVDLSDVVSSRE